MGYTSRPLVGTKSSGGRKSWHFDRVRKIVHYNVIMKEDGKIKLII